MSVDHYFNKKDQVEPFSETYLREKLAPDFKVTKITLFEETGLVRFFNVKPANKMFDSFNDVEMEFGWQDVTRHGDKEIIEDFKKSGEPLRRYMNSLSYASFKPPYRADCIKYHARVAELLDAVIGDPQSGFFNLSPQQYYEVKARKPKQSFLSVIKNGLARILRP
jgi:hypothetical protein